MAIRPLPVPALGKCLRRIFRWRVPPNWSFSDWRYEMRAQAEYAAWLAVSQYDPSFGVPFSAFVHQRILTSTFTYYRQEWAYALRLAQDVDPEGSDSRLLDPASSTVFDALPRSALARLSKSDLWIIEQLFLRGRTETEVATQIGVTQQTVSKRKRTILLRLRGFIAGKPFDWTNSHLARHAACRASKK